MEVRLNIYDENDRWVGVDYLTEKGNWMHKWVHKGKIERGSWRGRAIGENDINWRYEVLCEGKPVSDEPQTDTCNIPHVVGQSEQFTCKHCGTHEKQWSRKNDDWYCKTCGHICR